jgi:hypothetical protein
MTVIAGPNDKTEEQLLREYNDRIWALSKDTSEEFGLKIRELTVKMFPALNKASKDEQAAMAFGIIHSMLLNAVCFNGYNGFDPNGLMHVLGQLLDADEERKADIAALAEMHPGEMYQA